MVDFAFLFLDMICSTVDILKGLLLATILQEICVYSNIIR
jgi:hypothetical protein